jgi:hypothetical protein
MLVFNLISNLILILNLILVLILILFLFDHGNLVQHMGWGNQGSGPTHGGITRGGQHYGVCYKLCKNPFKASFS